LRAEEVRILPGAFGDSFRAVEMLPGVTPIASGVPYFFVRGAPPGNTGYFLDGIRVPALFHLGVGPSVIPPALIDKVDFHPGPYPARFGRFAGGIVAGELRPPEKRFHGQANVRVFDAGAVVEKPFADGRGVAMAGARYSYTGLLLPLFAPDTRLHYWDYQTRAHWDLKPGGDRIGVFAFGTFDTLKQRESGGAFDETLGFTFHRVDLRFDRPLEKGNLRVAATVGYDRSTQQGLESSRWTTGMRMQLDRELSKSLRYRAGADVAFDAYGATSTNTQRESALTLFPPRSDVTWGAYIDVALRATDRLEILPGLRADIYQSRYAGQAPAIAAVDPRLMARLKATRDVTLVTGAGMAHQPPSSFVQLPGLDIGRLHEGLQQATQISQGVELSLPESIQASAAVFYSRFRGLTDASSTCAAPNALEDDATCAAGRVGGQAYGLELSMRRSVGRFTGMLAYTLSRSTRGQRRVFGEGPLIVSEFDRPHVFNLVLQVDLGAGWFAGGRYYAYSGRPYSRLFENQPVPPINAQRLEGFHRFDARLEKRWQLKNGLRLAFVAEMLNVLLEKEALGLDCKWELNQSGLPQLNAAVSDKNGCTPSYVGPLAIPSIGVEGSW
jgi:hypothetical protein